MLQSPKLPSDKFPATRRTNRRPATTRKGRERPGSCCCFLKPSDLARVVIDTTVQPKAVMFPTDAKLLNRASGWCVNAVSIFLTCAEVKFPRRRVAVISRLDDLGLHFWVVDRGGAAAVRGLAS